MGRLMKMHVGIHWPKPCIARGSQDKGKGIGEGQGY